MEHAEINFLDIEENEEYIKYIKHIVNECFKEEGLDKKNLYINIVLTNPERIRDINKEQRQIDKETDVLSFPMFEKEEIENIIDDQFDVLGDIVISLEKVKGQAIEYGHSFERELAYMVVHGFYHLMGYDHMVEEDKIKMREKEENILNKLEIKRWFLCWVFSVWNFVFEDLNIEIQKQNTKYKIQKKNWGNKKWKEEKEEQKMIMAKY